MLVYRCDLTHPQSPELPTDPEVGAAVELLGVALSPRLTERLLWSDEGGVRQVWSELRGSATVALSLDPALRWQLYGTRGAVSLQAARALAAGCGDWARVVWAVETVSRVLRCGGSAAEVRRKCGGNFAAH